MPDQAPTVAIQVSCCESCAQGRPCDAKPQRNIMADLALAVVAGVLVRILYEKLMGRTQK